MTGIRNRRTAGPVGGRPPPATPAAHRCSRCLRQAQRRLAPCQAAPIIAFTDDDCEPAPGWLREGLRGHADERVSLLQGKVLAHPEDEHVGGRYARTIEVAEALADVPQRQPLLPPFDAGTRWGLRRNARVRGNTDLAWRVLESGGRARFCNDSVVWHAVRQVDFIGHMRSLPRWVSLPEVVKRHPQLRPLAHRRYFWKNTHPKAWLALAGIAGSVLEPAALALAIPHLRARRHAGLIVSDWMECLVMATGSLRARAVLL